MLAVPFITLGLGLAQQDSFQNTNVRNLYKNIVNVFKSSSENRFNKLGISFNENIIKPIGNSFKELWLGKNLSTKILGRSAIIGTVGLTLLANAMILHKSSIRNQTMNGGN